MVADQTVSVEAEPPEALASEPTDTQRKIEELWGQLQALQQDYAQYMFDTARLDAEGTWASHRAEAEAAPSRYPGRALRNPGPTSSRLRVRGRSQACRHINRCLQGPDTGVEGRGDRCSDCDTGGD